MDRIQLGQRDLLTTSLESDQPPYTPWYQLDWDPQTGLRFQVGCCKKPDNFIAQSNPKGFTEELWKHDVGELFIKHTNSDAYLEINLAPHAAWWACLFSGYREPASASDSSPFEPVAIQPVSLTSDSWESHITIPSMFLLEHLGFGSDSRMNVCFILGSPNKRHHFSRAHLPHDPPDFHHPSDFVPMMATED